MNAGQMLKDVKLAAKVKAEVAFYGRLGGVVPFPDEILKEIRLLNSPKKGQSSNGRHAWPEKLERLRGEERK